MKKTSVIIAVIFLIFPVINVSAEVPAKIVLKDGETIIAHHFGQLDCNGSTYIKKFIKIKGEYEGVSTEIKEYKTISKVELIDFSKDPVNSVGNEKATIIVHKTNGVTVVLKNAELILSCYGVDEKYNQIKVQIVHPLTDKIVEKSVNTKEIQFILFE